MLSIFDIVVILMANQEETFAAKENVGITNGKVQEAPLDLELATVYSSQSQDCTRFWVQISSRSIGKAPSMTNKLKIVVAIASLFLRT